MTAWLSSCFLSIFYNLIRFFPSFLFLCRSILWKAIRTIKKKSLKREIFMGIRNEFRFVKNEVFISS